MKKFTTIATMCLFGLMLSFSQAAEMKPKDVMMKDNMKESMDHNVMMKDDMKMKDDKMDKSDSMK